MYLLGTHLICFNFQCAHQANGGIICSGAFIYVLASAIWSLALTLWYNYSPHLAYKVSEHQLFSIFRWVAIRVYYTTPTSPFGRNVLFCAERFNCSINDLIYGRLPVIINSYVSNSVDDTTLDRVAFLRELIMIRDGSLTISDLLSNDELNDVISHVCTS